MPRAIQMAEEANDSIYIINEPKTINNYHVYLHEEVGDLAKYYKLNHMIRNGDPTDNFIIYLNNFGGNVHTGIEITNAVKASQSNIFTCISGPVYSMASLLALQGDMVYVEDDTFMMFHDYSAVEVGKGSEINAAVDNNKKFYYELCWKMVKGFLTKKEFNAMMNGKDFYIDRPEILKRLKKMGKLLNAKP